MSEAEQSDSEQLSINQTETDSPVAYIEADRLVADLPEDEVETVESSEREAVVSYIPGDDNNNKKRLELPRWLLLLIILAILIGWNFLIEWAGQTWFWSEQLMYWLSLAGTFTIIFLFMLWGLRSQVMPARSLMLVGLLGTLVAAIVLSIMKFINVSVFWTFFNLITQPLNALALSLLAMWLAFKLSSRSERRV